MQHSTDISPSLAANRWRWTYALFAALLLATPALAMLLTSEVNWGPGDFVVAAGLLAALGAGLELAARIGKTARGRALLMFGAVAVFLLVWAELAVGLFD